MRLTASGLAALALAVVGLLLAVDAAAQVSVDGAATTAMLIVAGVCAVAAGTLASLSRPGSSFGLLLEAAGCLWFISEWNTPSAGSAVIFTIGLICWATFPIVTAHAAFTFPAGRFVSRVERILVGVGYAVFFGLIGVAPALVLDPAAQGCRVCPANLIAVTSSPVTVRWLGTIGSICAVLVAVALAGAAVSRLVRSTPTARRMKALVLGPCTVLLVAVALTFLRGIARQAVPQDDTSQLLWQVGGAAMVALSFGVVLEWWRLRRARSRIAGFVIALGGAGDRANIRDVLAAALNDPTLDVAYPLTDGRLVTAAGAPAPAPVRQRATTALVRGGSTVALISHQRDLLGDPDLVQDVVSAARLPLDNERLSAEARSQVAVLEASQVRIIESGELERRRLERDLHDGAQQRLVALALGLRLARSAARDPADAAAIDRAAGHLRSVIVDLRRLASGIYPSVLADVGLSGALSALAEQSDHPVRIVTVPAGRLSSVVESTAYLLIAAICPCGAVQVRAVLDKGALAIAIDAEALPENMIDVTDRVGALGGTITVDRSAVGWSVRAEVPCES